MDGFSGSLGCPEPVPNLTHSEEQQTRPVSPDGKKGTRQRGEGGTRTHRNEHHPEGATCAQSLGLFSASLAFELCEGGGALLEPRFQDSAHPGSQRHKLPHHKLR